MSTRLSLAGLSFRVWIAFFAIACIWASVNAYADDTVFLYYDDVFQTSGTDVGTVLNSGYQGYTLKITGPATHSQKVTTSGLSFYGIGGKQTINVQTPNPNVPAYVFAKNRESLELKMWDIEYCGNADQNIRSVFFKDEYTGPSNNSLSINCFNVTISSFVAPDSEVCSVINNFNGGITLLSDKEYSNTFSNNKGCIRASAINFNPASTTNGPTGNWYFNNNFANNGSALYGFEIHLKEEGNYSFTGNSAAINGGAIFCTADYSGSGSVSSEGMCELLANDLTLNFEGNTAGEKGGAVYAYESYIHLSGDITFKNNRAGIGLDGKLLSDNIVSGKGGAIHSETSLPSQHYYPYKIGHILLSDSESKFESNLAFGDGGAIYGEGFVYLYENTSVNFLSNAAGFGYTDESTGQYIYHQGSGGAIYSKEYTYIEDSTTKFSQNSAYCGGAIYSESYARIQNAPSEFSKNSAYYGGAIYTKGNARIQESTAEFSENSAYSGGAIYSESRVLIPYNTSVKFLKNVAEFASIDESTGEYIYQHGSGGAIYSKRDIYILESSTEFSENSANYGGAIYSETFVEIGDSPVTFSGNKANLGGAIYTPYLQFWGDATTATFTGNYGNFYNNVIDNACGNDLYLPVNNLYDPDSDVCTNLLFWERGSYSFDGGIYIERGAYSDDPYNTLIYQAQVTIAGRANDSTNYYQLRNALLYTSGKLTAKLDEIEGINGIIAMVSSAKLELNVTDGYTKKLTMNIEDASSLAQDNDLAVQGSGLIEKTGDGTLQILAEAEGLVSAESFVVSSGRLDYKGYYTGALEVGGSGADAIFSSGNSVGDANVKGDVKIRNNGIALFEFGEYPGDDSNHDVLYITDGDFSAGNNMIRLYFENADADDWSYEGCKYLLVSGAGLPEGNFTSWLDNYTNLFSLLSESNNLYLVYPLPKPTPEPSTIALIALGVVILFLRKRVRN